MALTLLDKKRIMGAIKLPLNNVYYQDFYDTSRKSNYDDRDILNYLVDLLLARFENDYSVKMVNRLLYHTIRFFNHVNRDYGIDVLTYKKMLTIHEKYIDYLNYHTDIYDEEVNSQMLELKKLIEEHKPVEDDELEQAAQEAEEQITLGKLIEDLNKKLKAAEKEIDVLKSKLDQAKDKFQKKEKELTTSKNETSQAHKEIKSLNDEIVRLTKRIAELEDMIKGSEAKIRELERKVEAANKAYTKKASEVEGLTKSLHELEKEHERIAREKTKEEEQERSKHIEITKSRILDEHIIKAIIEEITKKDITISSIRDNLKEKGIKVSPEMIYQKIAFLSRKWRIEEKGIQDGEVVYGIDKSIPKPKEISISTTQDVIDIVLISNLMISDGESLKRTMSYIYDYCTANGINYIFNLGNFFNINEQVDTDQIKRLIDIAFQFYPKDHNIMNFILGGEYDINGLSLGLNHISTLCLNRSDLQDLGYSSANVSIGNQDIKDIRLHQSIREDIPDTIDQYLDEYYQKIGINRNKSFVDLLGSYGNGLLYMPRNFATIPSINNPDGLNGAYHLKIYTTHSNKKVLFIPLIVGPKVMQSSRIVYQKTNIKK